MSDFSGVPADVSDLAARYEAGTPMSRLASERGVCCHTVRRWLTRAGVEVPRWGTGRSRNADRTRAIAQMVAGGATLQATADAFGIKTSAVSHHCRRAGVVPQPLHRERNEAVRRRRRDGLTYAQIAVEFGIGLTTVHSICNGGRRG